ncbi:MAG: putative manganese-dependent inorganic diphosphatase [Treponema sp.]|nr:putative manganese-dependent inorganic diphosphatase [Treponema sp.]
MKNTVYIIGHRNPDTDSVVAATAYAKLKQLMGQDEYVAARAGHFNPQTEYIYKKFNVRPPLYVPDLIPKVQYYMNDQCETVDQGWSVWSALEKMERSQRAVLPVVDADGKYASLLHYNIFAKDVLTLLNPEHNVAIVTSISLIIKTMNAQPQVVTRADDNFKAFVVVGAAQLETFKKILEAHTSEEVIALADDRTDIQEACIDAGVRLLVLTAGTVLNKSLREKAEMRGVSVVSSPYATSSTMMLIYYSTPVSLMADAAVQPVHPDDTVTNVRPLIQASPCRCLPVVDNGGRVIGSIAEHDLLKEPCIEVVLVDHNELVQAVEGVEHFKIREVIDHHRLGMSGTKYPILFINKPVGSTATLIAGLYRENKVSIPKDIASILLCGILSDTLILQSATTTDIDRETAQYLSDITNLDIQELGTEILTAGSRVGNRSPADIVHQDMKEYTQGKIVYTVSQIEVNSTDEILNRKKEFFDELELERRGHKALCSVLLVTDITTLSSIMLVAGDTQFKLSDNLPKIEDNVYYLKDVVSRKKQLIPLLTEQIAVYAG